MTSRSCFLGFCFIVMICAILPGRVGAVDIKAEFGGAVSATNNLLNDSSKIFDAYTTASANLSYYPLAALEINVGAENAYYREKIGLSSILGRLRLTYIPIAESSPFSLQVSGDFNGIRYHRDFSGFDNNVVKAGAAAGYEITPRITVRSGVSFTSAIYVNMVSVDKEDYEAFCGGNISLPWSNSLDFEIGAANTEYTYIQEVADIPDILPADSFPRAEERLWSLYLSPRISRPIGSKTGISVLYTHRRFQNYDKQIIFGFSTQYLSPWAAVWEGKNVSVNLKTYLVPHVVIAAGAGYWDKTYLRTAERSHRFFIQAKRDVARQDWQTRFFCALTWPLARHSGLVVEPTANVEYTRNKSNKPLFYYTDTSFSVGVTVRW